MFRVRRKSENSGAIALEYAIVSIPFLLSVLGVLDFGFLVMGKQLITDVSREGGRLACVNTDVHNDANNLTPDEIEALCRTRLSPIIQNVEVEITNLDDENPGFGRPWALSATFQHRIQVEIRGEYKSIFPLFSLIHSGTTEPIPLTARAVIRSEGH